MWAIATVKHKPSIKCQREKGLKFAHNIVPKMNSFEHLGSIILFPVHLSGTIEIISNFVRNIWFSISMHMSIQMFLSLSTDS